MSFSTHHIDTDDNGITITPNYSTQPTSIGPSGETPQYRSSNSTKSPTTSTAGDARLSLSRSFISIDSLDEIPTFSSIPTTAYAPSEGLRHSPMSSPVSVDFPTIPVRPPLRPTVSFGGVSRHSYHSGIGFKDPMIVVVEEELNDRVDSPYQNDWTFYACFACYCILSFTSGLASSSCSTILPLIAQSLNLTAVQAFWIPISFFLVSTTFRPLVMRLSHVTGCKPLILIALVLFTLGSIGSALSHDVTTILISRCLEGAGSGAFGVLVTLSLSQLVSSTKRLTYENITTHAFYLGVSLGPIIGAAAAETLGWRSIFFIQVNLCGVGLLTLTILLRLPYSGARPLLTWLRDIDFLGWFLLTSSLISSTVALSWAGTTYSWTSIPTLLPLLLSIPLFLLYILHTTRTTTTPLLPLTLLTSLQTLTATLTLLTTTALFTILLYTIPLLLLTTFHLPPTTTALYLTPSTLLLLFSTLLTHHILRRTGTRIPTTLAAATASLSLGGLALLLPSPNSHTAALSLAPLIPLLAVLGLSLGVLMPGMRGVVRKAAATDDEVIHVGAVLGWIEGLGMLGGVVLGSTVVRGRFESVVLGLGVERVVGEHWTKDLVGLVGKLVGGEVDSEVGEVPGWAVAEACRMVWVVMAVLAGLVAVGCAVGLRDGGKRRGEGSEV